MSELALMENKDWVAGDAEQLVTMKIDEQTFGVPILQVQDIIEPKNITPVPLAPSAVAGVMNVRGRIVTCIDLRTCFGLGQGHERRYGKTKGKGVTVEYHGDLYTMLVDSIGDVQHLSRSDFEKPPATLDEKLRRLSTGVYRRDSDLLVVLDVNRILDVEALRETPPVKLMRLEATPVKKAQDETVDSDELAEAVSA